ncbi:MAG: hypothetical protein ACXAAK_04010 [Candidatus Thorarchaeota archaeon]|jgi:hypothetical protein
MSIVDTIQIENQDATPTISGLRKIINVISLTLVWAFLSALIVGSYAAAMWTVIPTDLLQWGAGKMNLIGYVSHCSFVPISTLTLVGAASIGVLLAYKLRRGRTIGKWVFVMTVAGLGIGLLFGIDIVMFIGMGAGVGIGTLLGLIIGIVRNADV